MRGDRRSGVLAFLAWMLGFAFSGWALWMLGDNPSLTVDWADPARWLATAPATQAVGAIARLIGLGIVAWVTIGSIVYLGVRLSGARASKLDWLSIGPIRRAVDTLMAGALVVTTMAPGAALAADPTSISQPTAESIDPGYIPIPAGSVADDAPEPPPAPVEAAPVSETSVVVAPGDHLWKLSERHLENLLGRTPTDAEVAPYWVEVIEANRDSIRSGDPDLIYPGEVIVLPERSET